MSDDAERKYARFLTDLDLVLADLDGRVVDERAQAHDVSPKGFRVHSRVELAEGRRVQFTMLLGDGEKVRGQAIVVWSARDEWGWFDAGAKITRLSWRDARKLRGTVAAPGYDFLGLARLAWKALFWTVIVAALHNVAFNQPHVKRVLVDIAPAAAAILVLFVGLRLLMRRD